MTNYIIKYSIYFKKTQAHQKDEIEIEDGVSFRDIEGCATIIVDSEDAVNYVRHLYKEDVTKLIKIPQEVWDDDESVDFTNKDTELVIESVIVK